MARTQGPSARKEGASEKKASTKPSRSMPRRALRAGSSLLRPKLKVGATSDPAERAADELADAVLRRADEARRKGKRELVEKEPPEVLKASPRVPHDAQEAPPHVQAHVSALKGSGQPLPQATQSALGPHLDADLGAVRVHTGSRAAALTEAVGARALTVGNDVAFNRGEYQPHTPGGQRLIAHELSHVAQQQAAAQPRVQREAKKKNAATDVPDREVREKFDESVGRLESTDDGFRLVFSSLDIPAFKYEAHRKKLYDARRGTYIRMRGYSRENEDTKQRRVWEINLQPKLQPLVENKVKQAFGEVTSKRQTVTLAYPISGTEAEEQKPATIQAHAKKLSLPTWGGRGAQLVSRKDKEGFHVDHVVELQVADWGHDPWANTIENFELLKGPINSSSGSLIDHRINDKVEQHLKAWRAQGDAAHAIPSVAQVLQKYELKFLKLDPAGGQAVAPEDFWRPAEIGLGAHLDDVVVSNPGLEARILLSDQPADEAFTLKAGNDKGQVEPVKPAQGALPFVSLTLASKQLLVGKGQRGEKELGTVTIEVREDAKNWKALAPRPVTIRRLNGASYAGVIDSGALIDATKSLESKAMSPIAFSDVSWDPTRGVIAHGKVVANHEGAGAGLYKKGAPAGPDVVIEGAKSKTSGTLPAEQLALPGPIEVKSSSVAFSGDEKSGLRADGALEVEARQFGVGRFSAGVSADAFHVTGDIEIKTPWFAPKSLHVTYDREDGLSGSVELHVPTGKIPGLKQGKAKLSIAGDTFGLAGEVQFAALGLEQTLSVGWSEDRGITIGGSIPIPSGKVPGVSGGSIDGQVTQTPEGELSFAAHGRADVAVPGLCGGIDVWWNDGLFKAEGAVATQHENLRGNVTVGVSNEEPGKDGQPTGKPGKSLHAYGKGHVEAVFGKNLRGAVDVALTPRAELVLDGELALQNEIKLFDLPQFPRKSLLGPWDMEFPILAVPAATITAFVGGGLYGEAGGGPAVLRNVKAGAHFEPSHPEKTLITGGAEFYLPVHAGLTLEVEAGLGAHVVAASVKGSLGVDATLGLDAEARAPVMLVWTPQAGIALSAFLNASVQPKFAFDVFGKVGVNVWPFGQVWGKRWDLKHFEWGPGIQFGLQWPITYKEAEGFQASLDDIKFIKPDLDVVQMLKGLVDEIT